VDESVDREDGLKPAVWKTPVPGDHGLKPVAERGCRLKPGKKDYLHCTAPWTSSHE
jgi:hypothetical protein